MWFRVEVAVLISGSGVGVSDIRLASGSHGGQASGVL